jgi:hypothetical protein
LTAKQISGHNKGVVGSVNKKLLESGSELSFAFHCIVNQETLCCKILSWREIMDTVMSAINFGDVNMVT